MLISSDGHFRICKPYVTEYSVCGSRAWARARLSDVTPECAIYASSPTSLFRESEQLQNLLSKSLYLLRDSYEPGSASRTSVIR
jgi:hypothetical protein